MADRFSWGSTDLIPTDKAGQAAMANRAVRDFLTSPKKRKKTPQQGS
jgi:hypothetical protein